MAIPYHLTIDIKQDWDSPYKLPRVTQNDTDIEFIITVKDGGQDVNVAERYSTITMTSQRPDRMAFYILGNVNEETGKIHFVLGSKEVELVGRVNASVQLYSVDGRQSTAHFSYSVRGDLSKQMVPTEKESTLIEQVLIDGPRIISEAEKAALDSIASLEDFNQDKAAALIELGEIKDSNRVIFRQPVNTFSDLATSYPNPEHGTTVRVTGESATYRYSDGSWVKTDEYNPTAIDQVTAQLADMVVNVKTYGATGDYNETTLTGTDNSAAFEAAIAEANKNHSELLIPTGIYYISKDIVFPRNVNCMGIIRGGKVIFTRTRDINVHNLSCDNVDFLGVWRGNINIRGAKKVTIDGSIDWMGTVWNQFSIKVIEELEINISNGFVNQNQFTGGRIGKLRITGTATKYPAVCEAHNNWFMNVDISSGGAVQDDAKMQTNYLINCYSEAANGGSLIVGNWQVLGNTGDRTPNVNVNSHILFSNDANPRSGQDYISMATGNMIEGGEWDSLDTKGRPKGVTYINANADVVADSTAPDGSGKAVKVQSGLSYASFIFNFKSTIASKGGITFYLKGDLATIELKTASGSLIYNTWSFITLPNGWKLYRVNIISENVISATFYLNAASASAKEVFFTGIKATPYKATALPYYNPSLYCRGSLPSVPTAGIWRKGEFVTNNNISTSPGVAMWMCVNDSPLTFVAVPLAAE